MGNYGYKLHLKSNRTDGRIYKNKTTALKHKKLVLKNNSLKTRKQTGYVNMKVKRYKLNNREKEELKENKYFIWS